MYDDKNIEIQDKALVLIAEVRRALNNGAKHFRKSDGMLLETDKVILRALIDEGEIIFEPRKESSCNCRFRDKFVDGKYLVCPNCGDRTFIKNS